MGSGVVLHVEPRIRWQQKRAAYFAEGFRKQGIQCELTGRRERLDERPAILLGTTCWRAVEATGRYLLVDRCSFGDTDTFVSLVWNGHGRRGDHRIPEEVTAERWERYGVPLQPWRTGSRVILCGQTESYSPRWDLSDWYYVCHDFGGATHFRPHPATPDATYASIPNAGDFTDCRLALTLNSSIGVQCVLNGIPTITCDEGAMAWDVTGHTFDDVRMPDRLPWCHRLAWTQYSDDEIREGKLWDWLL